MKPKVASLQRILRFPGAQCTRLVVNWRQFGLFDWQFLTLKFFLEFRSVHSLNFCRSDFTFSSEVQLFLNRQDLDFSTAHFTLTIYTVAINWRLLAGAQFVRQNSRISAFICRMYRTGSPETEYNKLSLIGECISKIRF